MKTGLGLSMKFRLFYAKFNLLRFWLYKKFLGFDVANQFITRVDKISLQLILRKNGAQIGHNCDIETGLTFHNCHDYHNLIIGDNCHVGKQCFFDLRGRVMIGKNVVISMKSSFITHQDMNKSDLKSIYPSSYEDIIINDNCYLGVNTIVLKGVEIGNNSIVAAGCVVVSDVIENMIVGGVPAKTIKRLNFLA
jgi:acetyltransferase-like isoleucine patch superfamily enzyme